MTETTDTILIVDDDAISLAFFKGIAEAQGFDVQTCGDAESGWGYFEKHGPRLIVLDWNLPNMSCVEKSRRQASVNMLRS